MQLLSVDLKPVPNQFNVLVNWCDIFLFRFMDVCFIARVSLNISKTSLSYNFVSDAV